MKLIKNTALRFALWISVILILIFIFISPIAEYIIEKNSIEWTGRKIEMKSLWMNPFTGSLTAKKLKIYEADQKNIFFSVNKIYTNLSILKAFTGKYDIEEVTILAPQAMIIQYGETFNFDDLIEKFSSTEKDTMPENEKPLEWWLRKLAIENISIKDSSFNQFIIQKTRNAYPLLSTQQKCVNYYGKEQLLQKVSALKQSRNEKLLNYLIINKKIPAERLIVHSGTAANSVSKSGLPKYLMNFNLAETTALL